MDAYALQPRCSPWYFVRTDDGDFAPIGQRRFWAFGLRRAPLGRAVRSPVLTATLMVIREGRKAQSIWHAHFDRYELTPDGWLDPVFRAAEENDVHALHAAWESIGSYQHDAPPAHIRLIRRRIETLYHWEPSAEDLERLARVANRRAGWPLMGPGKLQLTY